MAEVEEAKEEKFCSKIKAKKVKFQAHIMKSFFCYLHTKNRAIFRLYNP